MTRESAIRVEDAWYSYASGSPILRGLTLDVPEGEATVVMGPNGCGKTTLLRLLAGVARPERGAVLRSRAASARAAVGYIPQQLGLVRTRTARDNVLMGALARVPPVRAAIGLWPDDVASDAEDVLARVGLAAKADHKAHELSGGERQRVAIARALLQRPSVLVADEFVSNLDAVKAAEILDLTRELRAQGTTVVLALHNLDLALEYGDRIAFLRDGRTEAVYEDAAVPVEVARRHLAA